MTATIRKIRHGMYLFMLRVMSRFLPGSTHIAFVGSGSSRQLGQHIAALALSDQAAVANWASILRRWLHAKC